VLANNFYSLGFFFSSDIFVITGNGFYLFLKLIFILVKKPKKSQTKSICKVDYFACTETNFLSQIIQTFDGLRN